MHFPYPSISLSPIQLRRPHPIHFHHILASQARNLNHQYSHLQEMDYIHHPTREHTCRPPLREKVERDPGRKWYGLKDLQSRISIEEIFIVPPTMKVE